MPGIGIITNPHSRRNKRSPRAMQQLGYILGDRGDMAATQTLSDLDEVAEAFKEREIDVLGINGGDGTNHVTLTHFIRVYDGKPLPKIALLRGGTMNTIANGVGVKGTPATILHNIVEKYHTGEPFRTVRRDTLRIDDEYGFIFGNGVVQKFLDVYYEGGDASPWKAVKVLVRLTSSALSRGTLSRELLAKTPCELEADGKRYEADAYTTIMASTVEQVGLGFRPWARCEERPFSFHLLGITATPFEVAMQLGRIYLGRPFKPGYAEDIVASEAIIRSDDEVRYTVDGDTHSVKGELRLGTGPRVDIIVG